jgi:hypothetical protein
MILKEQSETVEQMTDNVMAKIKQTKGSKDFEFTHYK